MTTLLRLLVRHAGALLALLTVLLGLSHLNQQLRLLPLDPSVWQLELAFSADRFWGLLARWGPDGVALYKSHFALNHLHTLLYAAWGALMVSSSGLFSAWPPRGRWLLAAVLPAASVMHMLANGVVLHLLSLAPGAGATLVLLASGASLLKWLLVMGFAGVLAWRALRVLGPVVTPRLELRLPPLALAVGCAALMRLLAWTADTPRWWTLHWVWPAALALLGLGLALSAVQSFRRAGTTVNPRQPLATRAMVAQGVYRFSRNPMYLGMALMLAAWALHLGDGRSVWGVVFFVVYLQAFQIRPEERAMHAQFGPAFRLYCQQVRRWL